MHLFVYKPNQKIQFLVEEFWQYKFDVTTCNSLEEFYTKDNFDYDLSLMVVSKKEDIYALMKIIVLIPDLIVITADKQLTESLNYFNSVTVLKKNVADKTILKNLQDLGNRVNIKTFLKKPSLFLNLP